MNDAVRQWRLSGNVYLWRYKGNARNYPGWHLPADTLACASLLDLIKLMSDSQFTSEVMLPLSPPTPREIRLPNAKFIHLPATLLLIYYSPIKLTADHWQLTESNGRVRLEVGSDHLSEFQKGIAGIVPHENDYWIGVSGQELWFW